MAQVNEFNHRIIEEFRSRGGQVGGPLEGARLLLLHTTGAKSGQERINPIVYRPLDGGRFAVFASKAGAPTNPDWYHNLLAHPQATIEVGTETIPVTARVVSGEERDAIWVPHKTDNPGFAEYEDKTDREIPVLVLERVAP